MAAKAIAIPQSDSEKNILAPKREANKTETFERFSGVRSADIVSREYKQ